MYSHILIPTDGSELSTNAARQALELAKVCGAKVTAIMVSPPYRNIWDDGSEAPTTELVRKQWETQKYEHAKQILDGICADAAQAGIACCGTHVFNDAPYESIVDCANKNGCDMIAMGSHGYGEIKQFFIGSETTRVLSHTKIPVVAYR